MPEVIVKFNSRLHWAIAPLAAALLLTGPAEAAKRPPGVVCPVKSGKARLTAIDISDGPPAGMAFLAPDVSISSGSGFTNRWTLIGNPRGHWIKCSYGQTSVNLQLPQTAHKCSIRFNANQRVVRDGKQPVCTN